MCGIAGFIDKKGKLSDKNLVTMMDSMIHRGPDSSGLYFSQKEDYCIGLGHTRLSIIDTTSSGSQPQHYKHLSIVFNGEIYNYEEIRTQLINHGHTFLTKSDTEVILHAYEQWGLDCVNKFHGMWSFVIYNSNNNELYLCRDRVGTKPLHFYINKSILVFASEINSVLRVLKYTPEIDRHSLTSFFNYGYIPQNQSIYHEINKVPSGSWVIFDINSQNISLRPYWELKDQYDSSYSDELNSMDYKSLTNHVKETLIKAFEYRMVSDVPVGMFLSGGVDSSLVSAILNKECGYNINTYTVGFEEESYDESMWAQQISEIFSTNHTLEILTIDKAKQLIGNIPMYWDEPFGDSSALPTYLVSELASKSVKVSLSADGADELFLGYPRHSRILNRRNYWGPSLSGEALNNLNKILPFDSKVKREILKLARYYGSSNIIDAYDSILSEFGNTNLNHIGLGYLESRFKDSLRLLPYDGQLTAHELFYYLEGDILCKVDRASMANSIESREPFLDQSIIKLAFNLPKKDKNDGLIGKKILKSLLCEYIPKNIVYRDKQGFGVPIKQWMSHDFRHELKLFASESELSKQKESISKYVNDFCDGKVKYSNRVWYFYVFELWKRHHNVSFDI